jgi:hypothetical protein
MKRQIQSVAFDNWCLIEEVACIWTQARRNVADEFIYNIFEMATDNVMDRLIDEKIKEKKRLMKKRQKSFRLLSAEKRTASAGDSNKRDESFLQFFLTEFDRPGDDTASKPTTGASKVPLPLGRQFSQKQISSRNLLGSLDERDNINEEEEGIGGISFVELDAYAAKHGINSDSSDDDNASKASKRSQKSLKSKKNQKSPVRQRGAVSIQLNANNAKRNVAFVPPDQHKADNAINPSVASAAKPNAISVNYPQNAPSSSVVASSAVVAALPMPMLKQNSRYLQIPPSAPSNADVEGYLKKKTYDPTDYKAKKIIEKHQSMVQQMEREERKRLALVEKVRIELILPSCFPSFSNQIP